MSELKGQKRVFRVPPEEDGARIDRLVQVLAGISRKEARQWIGSGRVRAKGRAVRILAKRFSVGAQIEVMPTPESPKPAER